MRGSSNNIPVPKKDIIFQKRIMDEDFLFFIGETPAGRPQIRFGLIHKNIFINEMEFELIHNQEKVSYMRVYDQKPISFKDSKKYILFKASALNQAFMINFYNNAAYYKKAVNMEALKRKEYFMQGLFLNPIELKILKRAVKERRVHVENK